MNSCISKSVVENRTGPSKTESAGSKTPGYKKLLKSLGLKSRKVQLYWATHVYSGRRSEPTAFLYPVSTWVAQHNCTYLDFNPRDFANFLYPGVSNPLIPFLRVPFDFLLLILRYSYSSTLFRDFEGEKLWVKQNKGYMEFRLIT